MAAHRLTICAGLKRYNSLPHALPCLYVRTAKSCCSGGRSSTHSRGQHLTNTTQIHDVAANVHAKNARRPHPGVATAAAAGPAAASAGVVAAAGGYKDYKDPAYKRKINTLGPRTHGN